MCDQTAALIVPGLAILEQQRVLMVNATARAAGIKPGMRKATAQSLLGDLILKERSEKLENSRLQALAYWAAQFTPNLLIEPQAGLLLEVEASLLLFKGLDHVLTRLRQQLTHLGHQARLACAPTARGAWWLARQKDLTVVQDHKALHAALDLLPVKLLDLQTDDHELLQGLGIRRLGEFRALPRQGLARRVGPALIDRIDQAYGSAPDPRDWLSLPDQFTAYLELLWRADTADMLQAVTKPLITQACGWLTGRQGACTEFLFELQHDAPQAVSTLRVRAASPHRDLTRWTDLTRQALERLQLSDAVYGVRLKIEQITAQAPIPECLWPTPQSEAKALEQWLERLQIRLGPEQVRRMHLIEDHRPEYASRTSGVDKLAQIQGPAQSANNGPSGSDAYTSSAQIESSLSAHPDFGSRPQYRLPRPLWLLEAPIRLHERHHQPCCPNPLRLLAGPERIESGWWDQHLARRDYFVAENEDRCLLWIFRVPATEADSGWFLHGLYG